ncbi:EAL domain-containing protein [Brevibacillus borstelensis]|uniref:EAL domain-containing protein n=1 Tax=Brevibacillus borstelensis TaxID=45462 RepID=UPI00287FE9EB|nr:EAL domain-containing protein [Brevibacillus borstelensis]WNF08478.1 EAL domain-containing protein [Brevibacillus borstelensis]
MSQTRNCQVWRRSSDGIIRSVALFLPDQFITIAEETGLIVPIGEWVLRTACKQNREWQEMGYAPVRVAVNLSARQFLKALF